nr:hypothetical protein [Paraflavitalea speifideiaquila]
MQRAISIDPGQAIPGLSATTVKIPPIYQPPLPSGTTVFTLPLGFAKYRSGDPEVA